MEISPIECTMIETSKWKVSWNVLCIGIFAVELRQKPCFEWMNKRGLLKCYADHVFLGELSLERDTTHQINTIIIGLYQ